MLYVNDIVVATVTYGNRWKLLEQVLAKVQNIHQVSKVIIINNNTEYSLKDRVANLNSDLDIEIVDNKTDETGSASGFNLAISEAYKSGIKNILLLDDDNCPEINIFENLDRDLESINNNNVVIAFNRQRYLEKYFNSWKYKDKNWYNNSYCKFSVVHKLFPNLNTKTIPPKSKFVPVVYSQYSGLFFNRKLLDNVDLPNLDYYLYVDDTDFTYRITQAGYIILGYRDGKIIDLELSWTQTNQSAELDPHFTIFHSTSLDRGLYYIRNRVFFEKKYLVTNSLLYNLNRVIYLAYTFFKYMPKNKIGFQIFMKIISAHHNGSAGKLGRLN